MSTRSAVNTPRLFLESSTVSSIRLTPKCSTPHIHGGNHREPFGPSGDSYVSAAAGPLTGVRVLDLSWGIAGPVGVMLLADLGADVVKIEPPGGDPFRQQPAYHVWNRSRRSAVIDLKTDDGRNVFLRLCAGADVVVETFSPGTMGRLGLSYPELAESFPRLVYCSVPAYPPGHRFADRPGWDAPYKPAQECKMSNPAGGRAPCSSTSRRRAWPHAFCWQPACSPLSFTGSKVDEASTWRPLCIKV